VDAFLAQAFVDRGARAVGRLRMSAPDATVRPRVQTLVEDELVSREAPGDYRIGEPFLAEWIRRQAA